MKKIFYSLVLIVLGVAQAFAQAPKKLNYQGVARSSTGSPLASQNLGLRISILDGSASGTVIYQETQTATTYAYGLYNVVVGDGTAVTGTMSDVLWYNGDKYMKVEMDPAGGTSYTDLGATQLLTVPYALNASSVQASSNGGFGLNGSGASNLWWGFYENGAYRGYLGSYSGKNEDVDFGTGGSNALGSVHLCIAANPKLTVDSIGRVGIGTRFPQTNLEIVSSATDIINVGNQNGWTGIGLANTSSGPYNVIANGGTYLSFLYNSTPTTSISASNSKMLMDGTTNTFRPTSDNVMSLGATGARWTAVWAANGTIQTSDERYKTNIQPLAAGLNTIMQLKPISYNWKDEGLRLGTGVNYGFSAQELNATVPDLVIHTATPIDKETGKLTAAYQDAYGVKYAEFAPILVKAIQEQQAIIEALQKKVEELEQKLK